MPTYEYECLKCGLRFDYFQKMTDEPVKICPECSGEIKRIISGGAGFLFKGAGFYTTDYRSKSYVEAEKKDSGYKEPTTKKPDKEVKSEK
ncbi:MAG: zinc ribbon domain-containing protein [bacterium]|nr:zinc ribbon domain-containing protein [bacterium]